MKYIKSYRANNISELDESGIREREYIHQATEFNEASLPVEEITYSPDGSIEHSYKYQYNSEGKLIDELLIEADGEVTEHRSMEYNAEGLLIKEYIHYLDGTSDVLNFKYDANGRLLSRRSVDSNGETGNYLVNVFDGDILVSETEYDIAGEIITQRRLVYNENNKITEEIIRTPEEDYHIIYNYDENGKASVRRRYNEEKHLTERNTFTYDAEGRLSESMEESTSGIEVTFFGYDDSGNVIVQEEKTENGTLLSRVEYTYDDSNRLLSTVVFSEKPGQQVPVHYRIRKEYE